MDNIPLFTEEELSRTAYFLRYRKASDQVGIAAEALKAVAHGCSQLHSIGIQTAVYAGWDQETT